MSNPLAPTDISIGAVFADRYEIQAELGAGSFGRVYRARQVSTGQLVALKVMRVRGDESAVSLRTHAARFEREMELVGMLSHPNVVRMLDSGRGESGALYVVFEYVPGETLAQVLAREGALSPREALHLLTQVLDALACAHRNGILHRDLKPSNVMLSHTGARRNALVLDFGLGGFIDGARERESLALTQTGEFMGTPLYAAPEQLEGRRATERSDLYSWGLMLVECLLGRHALEGDEGAGVVRAAGGGERLVLPRWLQAHRLGRLLEILTRADPSQRDVEIESLLRTLDLAMYGELQEADDPAHPPLLPAGERRPVAVVSCRITLQPGAAESDVEQRDASLRECHAHCAEIATRWGGSEATRLGDRILLCFGHPYTREDDARRAARTALEIVSAMSGAEVRIGIHSGLVITRDLPGATRRAAVDVEGGTFELAVELDALAGPNEILVSAVAHGMLGGEPPSERIGEHALAGAARPIEVFRLALRLAPAPPPSPFIGRDGELRQLLEARVQADAGVPRCVLVSGEAGIGKSRLTRELRRRCPGTWLECRCLPEDQDTPLRPWIDLLTSHDASLETLVERGGLDRERIVPILSVLVGTQPPPSGQSRERQKELTHAALVSLVCGLARREPLGLVIEDLQWADPSTLELMERLTREIVTAGLVEPREAPRLLLLATARPEFAASWTDLTRLQLARLSPSEVKQMITARLEGVEQVARDTLERVMQHSDGVPLFVEEVTRVLVENAANPPDRGVPIEIPGSLRSLLSARLGALSPDARETAQLAAALGRDFDEEILARVSPKDAATLRADLAELVESELVLPRNASPGAAYVFKHALVRDAAYESMLRSARRGWHERIARTLIGHFPDRVEQRPELLAWHLEEAGDLAGAVDQRKRAGDRATARGAYLEAIRHFEKGAAMVQRLQRGPQRMRRELAIDESLGTALFSTRGYAAKEVQEIFSRARELCTELGGAIPFRVLWGLWAGQITNADERGTAELLDHFERLAAADPAPVHRLGAHAAASTRALYLGDFETALDESRKALTWWSTPQARAFAREYGYDIGIYAIANEMVSLNWLGEFDLAADACRRMLATAEKSGNPYGLAIARGHAMNFFLERDELDAALATSSQQISEATEQRLFLWIGPAMCTRGAAAARRGDLTQGIQQIEQGLALCRAIGFRLCEGLHLMGLADARRRSGDVDAALALIQAGIDHCAGTVDRFYAPELLRVRGELHRERGELDAAEADLRGAHEWVVARRARGIEPRIASSLAELLVERGARDEARAVLRSACDAFAPSVDVADLRRARALLAALG